MAAVYTTSRSFHSVSNLPKSTWIEPHSPSYTLLPCLSARLHLCRQHLCKSRWLFIREIISQDVDQLRSSSTYLHRSENNSPTAELTAPNLHSVFDQLLLKSTPYLLMNVFYMQKGCEWFSEMYNANKKNVRQPGSISRFQQNCITAWTGFAAWLTLLPALNVL